MAVGSLEPPQLDACPGKTKTLGVISLTVGKTNTEGGKAGQNRGAHSLGVVE